MAITRRKGCALALVGGCLFALLAGAGVFLLVAMLARTATRRVELARIAPELGPPVERVSAEDRRAYALAFETPGQAGVDALTELIEAHPHCYNLYYDRAHLERSLGDLEATRSDYELGTAMQIDGTGTYFPLDESDTPPPPFVALLYLAELTAVMGDTEQALEIARSALEWDPGHPYQPLVTIGLLQCRLGRFEEALPNFERALDCDDPWLLSAPRVQALTGKARALHGLGRDEEALESYALARRADWRAIDAGTHFDMALLMLDAGDLAGAERSLRYAQEIDPGNELVAEALRRLDEAQARERRTMDF